MTSFICGIQKEIIQMNLQNTKRLTDLEDNLWLPIHTAILKTERTYCGAHGTLLHDMWQPGWGCGAENGYICMGG